MLQTSNSFARSDTGGVIDSEPHPNRTCKTSLLFAPLAIRVQAVCSAFPFYIPRLFRAILGKDPWPKLGKKIKLTSKLGEINDIEHNKGTEFGSITLKSN